MPFKNACICLFFKQLIKNNRQLLKSDYITFVLFPIVIFALFLSERIRPDKSLKNRLFIILCGAVVLICELIAVYLVESKIALILFFLLTSILAFISGREKNKKKSGQELLADWDIFWSQLSFIVLITAFNNSDRWIILVGSTINFLADVSSSFTGYFTNGIKFRLVSDEKSILGSVTFAIVSLVMFLLLGYSTEVFPTMKSMSGLKFDSYFLMVVTVISIIITFFEVLSSKGFGKFIIPVIISFFIFYFLIELKPIQFNNYLVGIVLAAVIAALSYKVKFLTLNGSVATFLLAGFVFGLGGLKWSVPMMSFFILSSILSKLRKKINEEVETYFEKTGVRDYMQVIANGGIGGVLVILNSIYYSEIFFIIYLASLASVCADTWATEIGTWRKTTTYNILNLKLIKQGVSGGISLPGTIGAFLGALVIAVSGLAWINFNIVNYFFLIVFAGMFGSFFDSFLGATIQAQHKCVICEKTTEKVVHCGKKAEHQKGILWINNDVVNLLSGFSGVLIILILKSLVNL